MADVEIQVASNEAGEPTAVIVPIALCKEIAPERETAYLLESGPMRHRLLDALNSTGGVKLGDAAAQLGL